MPHIFISFRFNEAAAEAKLLQEALGKRGLHVYRCSVLPGENIARDVIRNLGEAKLVVILGTETYGLETPSPVSTLEELMIIKGMKKPFFLAKMCDNFEVLEARAFLNSAIAHYSWQGASRQTVPSELVDLILERLMNVEWPSAHASVLTKPLQSPMILPDPPVRTSIVDSIKRLLLASKFALIDMVYSLFPMTSILGVGNAFGGRERILTNGDSTSPPSEPTHSAVASSILPPHTAETIVPAEMEPTIVVQGDNNPVEQTGGASRTFEASHSQEVRAICFDSTGTIMASGYGDTTVKLWKVSDGSVIKQFQAHSDKVRSVAFHPDGLMVASGSDDTTVKLWNVEDGSLIRSINEHTRPILCVCFNPKGTILASSSAGGVTRLWDVKTGEPLAKLQGHRLSKVYSVAFSPSGSMIATGSDDKTIKLWTENGLLINTLTGHDKEVRSVSFHPSGSTLASASTDKTVKLWNVSSGSVMATINYSAALRSVCFHPSGLVLATGSYDNKINLWNLKDQHLPLIKTLEGHSNRVRVVCFDPTGTILASGSEDKTIRLWPVPNQLIPI